MAGLGGCPDDGKMTAPSRAGGFELPQGSVDVAPRDCQD